MSSKLEDLSQWLWELQTKLKRDFEIEEIYIGGASSVAILDHVWFRSPVILRDLDIYVVCGQKVDKGYAEIMAMTVQSDSLGMLDPVGVTPHIRGNPEKPSPERENYLAGWGFNLFKGQSSMDVTLYHSESEMPLNGIFNFDMIKLRLRTDQSLADFARAELSQFSYEELLVRKAVQDPHGGYLSWKKKEPKVVNWHEVDRDPIVQAVRVVRSLGKLGCGNVPSEIVRHVRPQIEKRTGYDKAKLEAALGRVEKDPRVRAERRMLLEVGLGRLI